MSSALSQEPNLAIVFGYVSWLLIVSKWGAVGFGGLVFGVEGLGDQDVEFEASISNHGSCFCLCLCVLRRPLGLAVLAL